MKTNTIYKIIIGGLLLLNIALMAVLFFHPEPRNQAQHEFLFEAVKVMQLNDQQEKEFKGLAEKHRYQLDELQQEQLVLTETYFQNPSEEILRKLAEIEVQKVALTEKHFTEIKSLLTTNQYPLFDKFKQEALKTILSTTNNQKSPPPFE